MSRSRSGKPGRIAQFRSLLWVGGSFCVKFPEVSCAMLEDKIKSAETIDANWLVAADAGCMLQIAGGLSRRDSKIKLLHLAQALAGPNNPGWPEEYRL